MELLPPEDWRVEPVVSRNGVATGDWEVSAWHANGVRVWALAVLASPPPTPEGEDGDGLPLRKPMPRGLPDDFVGLSVTNLDTGLAVGGVLEVDADAGYLVRVAQDAEGDFKADPATGGPLLERLEGRFQLND